MASYHSSFSYKGFNSAKDKNLIIVAFYADNGLADSYLSMDQVYEDNYSGTKRFLYGTKYNNVTTVTISVIKADGTEFSLIDVRDALKWLTGARAASWLDLYQGDVLKYSFLCTNANVKQYKMDARTIGLTIEFLATSPWAYSPEQYFDCSFGQKIFIDYDGVLYITDSELALHANEKGVLYYGTNSGFSVIDDGIVGIDNTISVLIDNKTDDLHTYIKLDTKFNNEKSNYLSIKNITLDEETKIMNMNINESILLSTEQFIVSDIPNKVFGDDFNFVWPRVAPGLNEFLISGSGSGNVQFTFRYPMKVADCAMDVDIDAINNICGTCPPGSGSTIETTVAWENITNTPTTIKGYGITNAYTMVEVDKKINGISIDEDELRSMLDNTLGT
jgi:hypothetical protein